MLKRIIYINLLIVLTTAIQILWFSPDGISSANMSTSPLSYIEVSCIIPAIILSILSYILRSMQASDSKQLLILSIVLVGYWIFANYVEFEDRVASWSTFSTAETWYYTLIYNPMPLIVCTTAFVVGAHLIFSNTRNQEIYAISNAEHPPFKYK